MRFSDEHETSSVVTFYGVPPLARTHWRSLCFELTNVEDYENLDEIIAACKRAVPENSELWGSKADVTERGQAVHQFLQRLRREDRETFARQVLPGMLNRERKRFIMGTKITVADVVAMFAIRPVIARWNRSPDVRYDSTDMLNLWDWFDFMQHAVKEFGDQSRYQVIHPPASHALLEQDLISPKDESLINLLWSTMANGGKASKKRTSASKKANAPRKETDWMLEDEAIASADTSFDTAIGSDANRKAKDAQTTSDLPDGFDLAEDEDVEMNLDFLMDEEEGEFEVRRGKSGSSSRAKRGSKANGTIASSNMTLFMNDMDHDTDLLGELNADTQNDQHGSEATSTFLESQGWGAASETATQGDPEHTRLSTTVEQGPGTTPPSTPASAPSKGKSPSKTTKEERSPLARVDIRVGCILTAKPHPDADALYVEEIDIGREDGPVTVCSGLRNHIPDAAALLGPCVVVANLKPVKMRGIVSQAMVLCATAADGSRVELIKPPSGAKPGDRIYFPGTDADRDNQPDPQLNPKKKIFEKVAEHLHTSDDASCEARYDEIPFMTDHGACRAATIQGGTIR
ncbi:hypothetical protein CCYA_CCYA11G3196 [Cyanidiococcus yangmingshanensis]|nr:hypothetical protein CCYA_CCYA11G3196 [Cyanidiococcus yangmingshanensis]